MRKNILMFLLGAGAGSAVTYFIVKNKYEKIANEEIESVVSVFKDRCDTCEYYKEGLKEGANCSDQETEENPKCSNESNDDVSQSEIDNYIVSLKDKVNNLGYSTDNDDEEFIAPYIISEEEFIDSDYEEQVLIYYNDNVLADECDNMIVDPEAVVGDALSEFDDYADIERIYVRNKTNRVDYNIFRSEKDFSDLHDNEEEY